MSRGSRVTFPMVATSTPRRTPPVDAVPEEIITWEKMYGLVAATPSISPTRRARANGPWTPPSRLVTGTGGGLADCVEGNGRGRARGGVFLHGNSKLPSQPPEEDGIGKPIRGNVRVPCDRAGDRYPLPGGGKIDRFPPDGNGGFPEG